MYMSLSVDTASATCTHFTHDAFGMQRAERIDGVKPGVSFSCMSVISTWTLHFWDLGSNEWCNLVRGCNLGAFSLGKQRRKIPLAPAAMQHIMQLFLCMTQILPVRLTFFYFSPDPVLVLSSPCSLMSVLFDFFFCYQQNTNQEIKS